MGSIQPTLSVLYSELVLSLYPVLIKSVQTNTFTQILARFLVFPALALAFGSTNDFRLIWGNPYEAFVGILNNVFNLLHIAVSYLSFKELPVGTAISLFYLYPIFNVIAGALLFQEGLSFLSVVSILIAFYGVYLITTSHNKEDTQKTKKYHFGVIMGVLAAITETLIFVFIRSNKDAQASPFYTVNHLYPAGLAGLLLYAIYHPNLVDTNSISWSKILGFNAFLGFTGYVARFYAIPRIPTLVFSLLSFIGVFFGYLWGIIFTNDVITTRGLLGSSLIAGSIGVLRYMGMV
jgi:drug/metabolite transporter (DMT)-like permease